MRLHEKTGGMLIIALLCIFSIGGSSEFSITTNDSDQWYPAIYGNIVVWADNRNGNADIYGYDLSTSTEFPICAQGRSQSDPAIYGNVVVWKDSRNGNPDIYGYDLSTSTEFPICTQGRSQPDLAIYGDIIVWRDYRNGNWGLYGYRLSTSEVFQITIGGGGDQTEPAIYGNIVVWTDTRNGNRDIFGYDLLTKFPLIILVDRGYSGKYYTGDMLTVQWIASEGGEITFWLKDADGRKIADLGSVASGSGQGQKGWTLKEEYGYGKKSIYAETNISYGSYSAECEFYITKKVPVIEVRVKDQNGNPISGAKVLLDNTFEASTDSSGICTFREVEFGEHTITVEFKGVEKSSSIQVTSTSIDIVFPPPPGSVYIRVFNQKNEPIENAEIYIDESKKGYTSENGAFEASVSEGSHAVEARWQDKKIERQVEVKSNEKTSVDLIIDTSQPVPYGILAIIGAIVVVIALIINANIRRKKEEEKKEEEKPQVLICPQCKNRIQKDWDTCPYCEMKLK